ncbi:MAG: phosphodiester glycosidase family protein [Armatimonadota bacterium]
MTRMIFAKVPTMQYDVLRQSSMNMGRLIAAILAASILITLAGCRVSSTQIAGVSYQHLSDPAPWSIHVVSFDLSQRGLGMLATVGKSVQGSETVPGMVTGLSHRWGVPVAAVNGDYFEYLTEPRFRGTLQGLCIADGELLSGSAGSTFWIDAKKQPHLDKVQAIFTLTWPNGKNVPFGLNCSTSDYKSEVRAADVVLYTPAFGPSTNTEGGYEYLLEPVDTHRWLPLRAGIQLQARVKEMHTTGNMAIPAGAMVLSIARNATDRIPALQPGETIAITTSFTPDLSNATAAVSGDPLLMAKGQIVPGLDNTNRAPRTAVGFNGTRCWLVVVDGRQPELSVGMSHHELAELMQHLGCTDAVNLDGGGSSTLWYQGKVMNAPSDKRLRPVGNALVLSHKP